MYLVQVSVKLSVQSSKALTVVSCGEGGPEVHVSTKSRKFPNHYYNIIG
jgi:hypothetical protein